jgi:hypothetical protein
MRLSVKDQIGAIQSALTQGAAEYRLHAANQRAQGNQDGVHYATIRALFLVELYGYLQAIAVTPGLEDPDNTFSIPRDALEEIADRAAARLHSTLHYDATRPGEAQIAVAAQERADQAAIAGAAPSDPGDVNK